MENLLCYQGNNKGNLMSNFILNVSVEEGIVGFQVETPMASAGRYESNWPYCSNS